MGFFKEFLEGESDGSDGSNGSSGSGGNGGNGGNGGRCEPHGQRWEWWERWGYTALMAFSKGIRWAMLRPKVTSSVYSSSLPTAMPRAMVEIVM